MHSLEESQEYDESCYYHHLSFHSLKFLPSRVIMSRQIMTLSPYFYVRNAQLETLYYCYAQHQEDV